MVVSGIDVSKHTLYVHVRAEVLFLPLFRWNEGEFPRTIPCADW